MVDIAWIKIIPSLKVRHTMSRPQHTTAGNGEKRSKSVQEPRGTMASMGTISYTTRV